MTEQQRKRSGSDSADYGTELGNFVQRIVTTVKPRLAVEDCGDIRFTLALAQGLSENGFGKLIACDSDATRCAQVQQEVAAAGLTAWLKCAINRGWKAELRAILTCSSVLPTT